MRVLAIAMVLGVAVACANAEAWAGGGGGGARTGVSTGPASISSSQGAAARAAGENWRVQWFEGRWWYWMPDNRWVYYQDNRWNDFTQPGQQSGQTARAAAYETANRGSAEPAVADRPESRDCPPAAEFERADRQPPDSWSVVGWPARVPGWGVGVH